MRACKDPIFYLNKTESELFDLIDNNWLTIIELPDSLKTEPICMKAIENNHKAVKYLPDNLKHDELFLLKAVSYKNWVLESLDDDQQFESVCLASVRQNGHCLKYVKKQTPKICFEALEQDLSSFELVTICANPDYETTVKNLNIIVNKNLIKRTINKI